MRWSGIARERGRLFVLVCASVLFVGLVAGIGMALAADESPSPGESKVVLKLGWTNEPDNLNPFVGYEGSSYEVWALNYDMLIGYAAEDGSPEGRIAESWEVSDDGLTWTFKIREGVKWQDGTPLTASDVAFSYNVIIDNDLTAYSTYTKNIDHVRAMDDTTVEMVCSQPKANMERLWVYVLPEHIWGKLKNVEKYRMEYPIVGSGPFQCAEWKKGNYVKMVKNPGYWGPEPTIDEIYFQYYTNSDTMAQEVRSGVLDGAVDIPTAQFKTFGDLEGFDAVAYNIFLWEYLSFNCYSEPQSLGDPVLRDVEAMDDDFNTPAAIGHLFDFCREINKHLDAGGGPADAQLFGETLTSLAGDVLGLRLQQEGSGGVEAAPFIELLLNLRAALRQKREFQMADQVRDQLQELGVAIEDGKEGTRWKVNR